jgi:UDP-glucose 4-epimerase
MNALDGYQGVRVAVLGASGFIGRWVVRLLGERKADLDLVVQDLAIAEEVFKDYQIQGRVHELELADFPAVREFISAIRPRILFNLAGYGVRKAERDENVAFQINARLVGFLCEAMEKVRDRNWPGRDLVHVGSALEYGQMGGDLAEDSIPNPLTLYGRSKLEGTILLKHRCRGLGVRGLTARLFMVYGPGEHPGRLLPSLLDTARTGIPLKLTSGVQKRDFTYVEDVAEGLLRLGLTEAEPGEVVNLATGKLTSVRQFVKIAAKEMMIPLENLIFDAIPTEWPEMEHLPVSIDRLRRLAAWVPGTDVAEGIRKTLSFEDEISLTNARQDA